MTGPRSTTSTRRSRWSSATPERHQEIAMFQVLDGRTWNHPAIVDGYLLVRNINETAAFDLRVQ